MGGAARRAVLDDDVDLVGDPRRAERPLALGLDIGTSSVRAVAYGRLGRRVGGFRVPYAWTTTPGGGVETDADALIDDATRAVDGVLAAVGPAAADIAAVGASAFWHGLVGVDESGAAVTPVYPWHDRRATQAARRLRARFDERAVHARTGAVLHPSYLPARLVWLHDARPEQFERARYWMSPGEHMALRLFGERRVSVSMASATGLFDQSRCTWDSELLGRLPISAEQLSPVVDLDEPFVGLRRTWAERWPALAELPWLPAVGDGAAANVGSGCTSPASAALSLGTSAAIRVLAPEESVTRTPEGLWRYRLDRRRVVVGGAAANGGIVYAWLRRTLDVPPEAELERRLRGREPDAHGLTMLPYLAGSRSPDWPLEPTSAMVGFTLDTTPVDILQAGLEAVAYRLALIREPVGDAFPDIRRLVGGGGALVRSPAWARILTDVLSERLVLPTVREVSARGAALLAQEAVGALDDIADAPRPWGDELEPNAGRHARYRAGLERYRALNERLADGLRRT